MSTRRAIRHKERTFGGVAACPHCSAPIRVWVQAARVQCVLDVVAASYSLPTPPLEQGVELDRAEGVLAVSARVVGLDDTVVDGADAPSTDANARAVAYSDERGFDDDEAPSPPQGELDLG